MLEVRPGVRRVVHFHCDHFEPFTQTTGFGHALALLDEARKHSHTARASLFYAAQRWLPFPNGTDFYEGGYTDQESRLLDVFRARDIDLQVHVHHEFWPRSDSRILRRFLNLTLTNYREHGLVQGEWAFVHGCWALNASDDSICKITNEMMILSEHGCVGDFSFPAGRRHCDPQIKAPFTVVPRDAVKAYDGPEAEPILVGEEALLPGRLLIWSSQLPYDHGSLDVGPSKTTVQAWLNLSPVVEGTLFLKTFCHTLQPAFSAQVEGAFSALREECHRSGVDFVHATVSEVLSELRRLD